MCLVFVVELLSGLLKTKIAYVCHFAVPQVDQPVGCLLDNHVIVPLVGRAGVVVVPEVAQPGALEVPVAAARLAALLGPHSIDVFSPESAPKNAPQGTGTGWGIQCASFLVVCGGLRNCHKRLF